MEGFFRFLSAIGLRTCLARAIFGAAIGFLPVLFKSRPFYTSIPVGGEDSSEYLSIPKVFAPFAPEGTDPAHTTLFPWYFLPLLLAFVFSQCL
jgi:hypothetical protein